MAENEVEKLAGNLSDLNKVSLQAGIEFKGLTKRLITMSDNISGAGKKWTIFARIVSGSPLWRLQNKVRAFVDSLALVQEASERNAKAAKEQNQRVIDQVQAYQSLKKPLEMINKLQEDSHNRTRLDVKMRYEKNRELKESLEGTLAYNKAILEGDNANQAYKKGLEELIKKGEQQTEVFKQAQSVAKFAKNLKTVEGRGEIRSGLEEERKEMGKGKTIGKFKGMPLRQAPLMSLTAATFTSIYDVFKPSVKKSFSLEKIKEKIAMKSLKFQKGMLGFAKAAKPVINYAFKVMVMLMLGIMGFLVLAKFIHDSLGILKEMGVINDIMEIGSLVLENVMLIFSMIGALLSGDIYTFLDYALEFVDNLLLIGLGLIKVVLKGLLALAIGVFYTVIDIVVRFITGIFGGENAEFTSAVFKILKKALFIFLAAYVIKQIAIQMLTVAAIYAMPILIGAVIIAGIAALFRKVFKFIPFFADGGVSDGGLSVVGEKGPEMVSLPKGARVHSNAESKKMASSNVVNNNVNVTINAKDTSDAELRRIADQVGNMITNKLNRTTSSSGFVR